MRPDQETVANIAEHAAAHDDSEPDPTGRLAALETHLDLTRAALKQNDRAIRELRAELKGERARSRQLEAQLDTPDQATPKERVANWHSLGFELGRAVAKRLASRILGSPTPAASSLGPMPTPTPGHTPMPGPTPQRVAKPRRPFILDRLEERPRPVGPAHEVSPRLDDLQVVAIVDEVTYECLRFECHLTQLPRTGWQEMLDELEPDLLFVEAAWHGVDGQWHDHITNDVRFPRQPLIELVSTCRNRGIPTVFWNKEDPLNYDRFLRAARLFDFVFTTDADCVPRYHRDLGHPRVWALPFAAQPAIHNPVGAPYVREHDLGFAGSWHRETATQKRVDTETLLVPAIRRGLHIYGADNPAQVGLAPSPVTEQAFQGPLDYSTMMEVYRRYRLFINVNSVQDSPTTCARRLFELLACGTPVVSGHAQGIVELLGEELVPMARDAEETDKWLDVLLTSAELRERTAHRAMRKVLTEHTYKRRMDVLLDKVGIRALADTSPPLVSVITCTCRPDQVDNLLHNFDRQSHTERELLVVVNSDTMDPTQVEERARELSVPRVRVFQQPAHVSLGSCLNDAIDLAAGERVCKLDDDDFCGQNLISDLILAMDYSGADIVGKRASYVFLESSQTLAVFCPELEHRYCNWVSGGAMLVARRVFNRVRFTDRSVGEDSLFGNDACAAGFRIYAADRFNFVRIRKADPGFHTFQADDAAILRRSQVIAFTGEYATHASV